MQEDFWEIVAFNSVSSTNEVLKKLVIEEQVKNRIAVIAKKQTSGYGRRTRKWESPQGNMYCSALITPTPRQIKDVTQLSFVVSVAVAEAIESLSETVVTQCKWPNDVLIKGQKVSGILLETIGKTSVPLQHIVVGVGINVENAPTDIKNLSYPVSSLSDEGIDISVNEMLPIYLKHLKKWLDIWEEQGFDSIKEFWLQRAKGIGEEIKIDFGKNSMSGVFSGLDQDGALLLRLSDGKERRITTGDIFFSSVL